MPTLNYNSLNSCVIIINKNDRFDHSVKGLLINIEKSLREKMITKKQKDELLNKLNYQPLTAGERLCKILLYKAMPGAKPGAGRFLPIGD